MKKALLVGLTNYPSYPLAFCDNDAISMKDLLESNGNGDPNFATKLITDSATRGELTSEINNLFSGEADVALLYFSGHGTDFANGYLVTTDVSKGNFGVSMADVLSLANKSKIKNRVIILDCCFSGKFGENVTVSTESILGEGLTIMAASQNYECSSESKQLEHGIFTNLLIQGLKGGAADISGRITPASLYSYVDQSLGPWEQRPVFKTNSSTFLPLREVQPKVPKPTLRKLSQYFTNPTDIYQLDPSFEFTNSPNIKHELIEPYADAKNVEIFRDLQQFASVGLVEPTDSDHMYFAAMESKGCKLTASGLHYWQLSKDKRF